MGNDARRKERQRRKRQERHRQLNKLKHRSPFQAIRAQDGETACYINDDWQEGGKASVYLVRQMPGGGYALAAFLVDLWCMGLKDAWGDLRFPIAELERIKSRSAESDLNIIRVDIDVVRRLVFGGIRFARQNGFRLPPHYDRWLSFIGPTVDFDSADLSAFGKDGKLFYTGSMEDLRRRLIGSSPEQFLKRKDVGYILDDTGFTLLDDDNLVLEEAQDKLGNATVDAIRRWCFANGEKPSPSLEQAWGLMLEAILQIQSDSDEDLDDDEQAMTEEQMNEGMDNFQNFLDMQPPEEQQELLTARSQIQRFMTSAASPDELLEKLGIEDVADSED